MDESRGHFPCWARMKRLLLAIATSTGLGCATVSVAGVALPDHIPRVIVESAKQTTMTPPPKPDYATVLIVPPLVARGVAGNTIAGMTEAESRTSIDGFDIANPSSGTPRLTLQRAGIRTEESGYEAQYGGASGGQVILSRPVGSNFLRGEAGMRMSPRIAAPRLLSPDDDALRVTEIDHLQTQIYARVSLPIIKDKLFFSGEVTGTRTNAILTQSFRKRVGTSGATETFAEQSFPTGTWQLGYFAGLDWNITKSHWLALMALGGPSFQRTSYRLPYSPEPNAFGNNPAIDPLGGTSRNDNGIVNDHFGTTLRHDTVAILAYRGRVRDDGLGIDATLGYSQFVDQQAWRLDHPELERIPATQTTSNKGSDLLALLDREGATSLVPGVREACDDDLPGVACPTRTWVSGGLGEIDRDVSRRFAGSLVLSYPIEAGRGRNPRRHQLRGGFGVEWLQRHGVYRYSGHNDRHFLATCDAGQTDSGEVCYDPKNDEYEFDNSTRVDNHRFVLIDADDPSAAQTRGFGRARHEQHDLRAITDLDGHGARFDTYDETVSSLNYGMFLQDRWLPAPNLALSGGLRWEIQDLRDIYGDTRILLANNVAPRFGVAYDWTNSGRSRLYANYGLYYQPLPLQLASRMFGGLVSVGRNYLRSDCDSTHTSYDDGDPPSEWCVDRGGYTTGSHAPAIVPGLKGQYNHQLGLGYDHEVIDDLVLSLRWQHTALGRAVEDISIDGGDVLLANPGVAVERDRIDDQGAQCETLQDGFNSVIPSDDLRGPIARELRHCEALLDAYESVGTAFRKPTRRYDGLTAQVHKRFAKDWHLLASYTYSRLIGDYDGFVDPINGSINLGASPQYDTPELVRNSFGPLARDVPHRLTLDGVYVVDLGRSGQLVVGTSFRLRSGVPISVRSGQSYLLPRGAGGRVEPNAQWNITLSYTYWLPKAIDIEFIVRVFNVTNSKATLRVDENYSQDDARAIAGGDTQELAHAKIVGADGRFFGHELVTRRQHFGAPVQLQQPIAAQFELKLWF
jgi:hypothetical protein